MELNITSEQFFGALAVLIAAAVVVTKLLDGLKPHLSEFDGAIGVANQVISFVVALIGFVLHYFQQGWRVANAEALGLDIAAAVVSTYVISFLAWLIHTQVVKRINGEKVVEGKAAAR